MLNQQNSHIAKSQSGQKGFLSKFYDVAIQGKMIYMMFFTFGAVVTLIISVFFSGPTLITIKIIEQSLLSVAVIIKSIAVSKVLSLKQLLKTQSQFPIPYLFTGINIYLIAQVCIFQNLYDSTQTTVNVQYAILESLRFFFMTFICSLITNKKTTSKLEYWFFLTILIIVVCVDVQLIVLKVKHYGILTDAQSDILSSNQIAYVQKIISFEQYTQVNDLNSAKQSAIQNAANLDLACVASIIANYLVMMDMIARPIQKIKEKKLIIHEITSSNASNPDITDISRGLLQKNNILNGTQNESDRTQSQRNYQREQNVVQFKVRNSNL